MGLFGRNNGLGNAGIWILYFYGTSKGSVWKRNDTGTITNCYNTGGVSGSSVSGLYDTASQTVIIPIFVDSERNYHKQLLPAASVA